MKNITILSLILFCAAVATGVNAAWFKQEFPTYNAFFMDIEALSETDAIVVGDNGTILYTSNGGETWTESNEETDAFLNSIEQADGVSIFAVGSGGAILKSIDNGVNWDIQTSAVTKNFYAVDVKNGGKVIAVGEGGSVAWTLNNGSVWNKSTNNSNQNLLGVGFINSSNAIAVGEAGVIIKSADNGSTWNARTSGTEENLNDVVFLTNSLGYAVGDNATLIKTTDSGMSWEAVEVPILDSQNLLAIDALDENNILIAGADIAIVSHDGGVTWIEEDYIDEANSLFGASYASSDIRFAVGTNLVGSAEIFKFDASVTEIIEAPIKDPVEEPTVVLDRELVSLECAANVDVNDPCKAVYYIGEDGKRHAFPNDKVYFTWYENFDLVETIDLETLTSYPLGKNATYKPGIKMVKFQSVNTVYAVGTGGVLQAIDSEEIAELLYGADWNKQIDDISDAFFGNYTFGDDILSADDYDVSAVESSATNIDSIFI